MNNPNINMGAGTQSSTQIKINPFAYPSMKCTECQNETFVPGVIFKEIPGLLVGSQEKIVRVPIKVYLCSSCHKISPVDEEMIKAEEELLAQSEAGKQSKIII